MAPISRSAPHHPATDFSGMPFGRPDAKLLVSPEDAAREASFGMSMEATGLLAGQDAIDISRLTPGLAVYAGYVQGSFVNYGPLCQAHPDAKNVSITPFVTPAMCGDIEPGNMGPDSAPGFVKQANLGGVVTRPVIYASAGDVATINGILSGAGFPRSAYLIWSAHWNVGLHICAPAICGFPAADATQYASNNDFDSDIWSAYAFKNPGPPTATPVLTQGDVDPINGVNAVHSAQARLIAWSALTGTPDGNFGPDTLVAVKGFQTMMGLTIDGVVGPQTWTSLLAAPSTFTYGAPAITGFVAGITTFRATLVAPLHYGNPVPDYRVYVYEGQADASHLVSSYAPDGRTVQAATNVVTFQEGGLQTSTSYILHVVATAPDGTGIRPFAYAVQQFTTGS